MHLPDVERRSHYWFHNGTPSIVAAAIQHEDVVYAVKRPARHHNVLAMMKHRYELRRCNKDQGFLVSDGRYVGRNEGEAIARSSGQLRGAMKGGVLTSEDLW